jgi:hypothetical protein
MEEAESKHTLVTTYLIVSTNNTTIYGKEINYENEQSCETQGRQMVNRMSAS